SGSGQGCLSNRKSIARNPRSVTVSELPRGTRCPVRRPGEWWTIADGRVSGFEDSGAPIATDALIAPGSGWAPAGVLLTDPSVEFHSLRRASVRSTPGPDWLSSQDGFLGQGASSPRHRQKVIGPGRRAFAGPLPLPIRKVPSFDTLAKARPVIATFTS